MLELVKETDSILHRATPAFDFKVVPEGFETIEEYLLDLTNSMFETMRLENGAGLAAPQVGLNLRLFVMSIVSKGIDEDVVCINPTVIGKSEDQEIRSEGCLSFPKLNLKIKRPNEVFVSYNNMDGTELQRTFTYFAGRCFLHELDHLNGITFDSLASRLSLQMAKKAREKKLKQTKRRK